MATWNSVNSPENRNKEDLTYTWIDSKEPFKHIAPTVRTLIQAQSSRLWNNSRYLSLYSNTDWTQTYYTTNTTFRPQVPRLTVNLLKVYGDSLAGKLVQNSSRVTGQAVGGDFSLHQRIKKLDQMLDGEFQRGNVYRESMQVALDAINTGTGYMQIHRDGEKICYERVFPNEVFVDELEAAYTDPTVMFRVRYLKRENVKALWPKYADKIDSASPPNPLGFAWTIYNPGMIEVFEAWAIPYGARKGRHVICTSNCTLVDEPYNEECFPFAIFKAGTRPLGWYGQGYIEQIGGAQVEMNKILHIMSRSAHLGMAPFWVVASGANINVEHLRNEIGHIVKTDGPPPQWVTNQPFSQAAPAYVDMLQSKISDYYGINQMEATGGMPLNRLDSRKALIEFQDMSATRQTVLLKYWEYFFLDVAKRTINIAKQIAKSKGEFPVITSAGYGKSQVLDWHDYVDIEEGDFRLTLAPSNILSMTPAAKKNDIIDMMQAADPSGKPLLTAEQGLALLQGPPDIASVVNEVSAPENYISMVIERLMDGTYEPPEPRLAPYIDRAIKRVTDASFQAETDGCGQEIIDLFDQWLGDAAELKTSLLPPMPMGMPPMPGLGPEGAAPLPGGDPLAALMGGGGPPPGGGMPPLPGM